MSILPKNTRVVIIGGGIIGCSVAYHLSKIKGFNDIVVLEQGKLTCGTTWHAAGLIGQLRSTKSETDLSKLGCELYESLDKMGHFTGFRRNGSITIASNNQRLEFLKRNKSRCKSFGIECEIISPEETLKKFPFLNIEDIKASLWLPNDGTANSSDITMAFAALAKENGTKIFENIAVEKYKIDEKNSIKGVLTSTGETIESEIVVNCSGLWGRSLDKNLHLHPVHHMYMVTEPFGVDANLPSLRDYCSYLYAREWSGGLLMGGFEPNAKVCFSNQKKFEKLQFHQFEEDYEQFDLVLNNALHRFPQFGTVGLRQFFNGPESFTSDSHHILGESPDIRNLYLACGFNSSGIANSAGAGLALSEWIEAKRPTRDLWTIDPRRFPRNLATKQYLTERTSEIVSYIYDMPFPFRELKTSRNLKQSPFYDVLASKGGCFGQRFGWERPLVFLPEDKVKDFDEMLKTFKPHPLIFQKNGEEHIHTRTKVSLFDQTSFSKLLVQGKDACKALDWLCCSNMDTPVGKIVYTPMVNEAGFYEADLTITRVSINSYLVVTSAANCIIDMTRIERIIEDKDFNATVCDVSSSYACLGLMGPNSRNLLQELCTQDDISNEELPFAFSKEVEIGSVKVRANRITYVGTLGYELYIPTESAKYIYNQIWKIGKKHELRDCGYFAIETLRTEKGYRAWGHELASDINPLEAGLGFTINWKKEFLGKEALLKHKEKGNFQRVVILTIEDEGENLYFVGHEPILRNGKLVGYTESVGYGYSLKKWVVIALVESESEKITKKWIENAEYHIEFYGDKKKAQPHFKTPFDPLNKDIHA